MSGQTALILGATGATGKFLLRELLGSPNFTKVGEFGRRITPLDDHLPNKEKLTQKVIDFENVHQAGLNDEKWDVVFITLGTSRAQAGGAENFRRIDQEYTFTGSIARYVVNAAKASRIPEHKQRLVYLSSSGADASARVLYTKSKGETENRLASLGYDDNIICRPGPLLNANRSETRILEQLFNPLFKLASSFSDNVGMPVTSVAKAMRIAAELGSSGLPTTAQAIKAGSAEAKFTVIPNSGLLALARS
ncbi:hypothetical protein Clacol_001063 [Clathrus columnatus]|uniref:NAD(P)-binding domain-containing protein n=1 Tax=Clathrus columnatus TaxID=1419009 RepID=A0AAV5A0D4_9AGAM|nr:hypothetical protein Clacol_001063 [Clathrus columnatus]